MASLGGSRAVVFASDWQLALPARHLRKRQSRGRVILMASDEGREFHLVVDVRGLDPPEPMVRVLKSLDSLPIGKRMLLLIHREPRTLVRVLDRNGYDAQCQ